MSDLSKKKYRYYESSVQSPEEDIELLNEKFKEIRKRKPFTLREDFCGTGWLACEWVKQGKKYQSIGVDIDPEPIAYGKERHLGKLKPAQAKRMSYVQEDVRKVSGPRSDIVVAFNFSYSIFKTRKELVKYFRAVRKNMRPDGVFFLDVMGGPDSQMANVEKRKHGSITYYWECKTFNPINNDCEFTISFKPKGKKKIKDVFTYEWRFWNPVELRELLEEAGFRKTIAYWEGDDGKGGGNGKFTASEKEENCDCWIIYLAATP